MSEELRERLAEALDDVLPEAGFEGLFEDVFTRTLPLIHAERDKARAEVRERVEAVLTGDYANSKHVSGWAVVRVNDVHAALDGE